MMMPTSKNPFLATAAALVLGWSMLVPMPLAAQDAQKPEGSTTVTKQVEPSTAPPRNLKKVGDHWTPYNPPDPESFPEGAALHIIVPGETLWGLADLTYNNPYLWPQLWNENRYITDSHWIYPGDPLLVPARPVVVTDAGPSAAAPEIVPQGQEGAPSTSLAPLTGPEDANAQGEPIQEPLAAESAGSKAAPSAGGRSAADSPTAARHLVYDQEVRCTGFIAEDSKRGDLFIAEGEEQKFQRLTEGSIVYLNHGKDDPRMQPGAEFSIVEREGKVLHPMSDKSEGFYYNRRGGVKILRVLPETAVATITYACDEIRVGNELQVYEAPSIPERPVPRFDRMRFERNGKATGVVIHTKDTVDDVGTGHMVDIDLGQEDGLAPGDFLTAFEPVGRTRRPHQSDYHYKFDGEVFYGTDLHYDNDGKEYPAKPVGQMIVVRTGSHTATAKIIYAVIEMHVGTIVEVD
jgi:LysM domain